MFFVTLAVTKIMKRLTHIFGITVPLICLGAGRPVV